MDRDVEDDFSYFGAPADEHLPRQAGPLLLEAATIRAIAILTTVAHGERTDTGFRLTLDPKQIDDMIAEIGAYATIVVRQLPETGEHVVEVTAEPRR